MIQRDTASEIRFLESVGNLKRVIHASTGRNINTETALQVCSCLQQGRLFFAAASNGATEIRPLLLSYGTIAFAKAAVIARSFTKLETLPQSHGLKDISAHNAMMKDLRIKIAGAGFFQHSVDAARSVERLALLDGTSTIWIPTPSCQSAELTSLELSLKSILGRLGDLAALYAETFSDASMTISTTLLQRADSRDVYDLQVDIPAAGAPSAEVLLSILGDLKQRFPLLSKLNFFAASFVWDHIRIVFNNSKPGGRFPEIESDIQTVDNGTQLLPVQEKPDSELEAIPLAEILPCSQGGLYGSFPTFTSPVLDSAYLSELTLLYLGTYLLGSLVRYRPSTWVHSLYGTEASHRPRDDAMRALIEDFLDLASSRVPRWCAAAIRAPRLP